MARQTIGVGSVANDGNGDTLRVALQKVNENFDNTYVQGWGQLNPGDTVIYVGDSNTRGRTTFETATAYEWEPIGGIFHGCEVLNYGQNGSQIQGWQQSIAGGDQEQTELIDGTANVWLVKNRNPKLIILSLGTNELFLAERRAAEGAEATMQANFDELVQWFLDNTDAFILLRMPQPFAWATPGAFGDWVDADACALSSEQLRRVHLNCSNLNHPRVRLYDSHKAYWGYRLDTVSEFKDPETGLDGMSDPLHPTDMGMRQTVRQMADMIRGGGRARAYETIADSNLDAILNAVWSETVWVQSVNTGSQILEILLDPMCRVENFLSTRRLQNCPVPESRQIHLPAIRALSQYGIYQRLAALGSTGGEAKVFLYFQNSGNVYSIARFTPSQIVDDNEPYYLQTTVENLQNYAADTSASFQADDVGACLVWVENAAHAPGTAVRNEQKDSLTWHVWPNAADVLSTGDKLPKMKFPYAFTDVTFSAYASTAPSGGVCSFQAAQNGVDLTPFGLYFEDGSQTAICPSFAGTSFAVGDILEWRCLVASGAKGITIIATGKRVIY